MLQSEKQTSRSVREAFDVVIEPKVDLKTYIIRGGEKIPPIYNLIVIGICLGLFIYVNSYYVTKVLQALNGTIEQIPTQTFPCQQFYCDKSAYNYINYNTFYKECNEKICNTICSNYTCTASSTYPANFYYACQTYKCGALLPNPPKGVSTSYVLTLIGCAVYAFAALMSFTYGVVMCIRHRELTALERAGFLCSFFWPKLKYYAFRRRQYWQNFTLNLKTMVIMDIVLIVPYVVTSIIYCLLFTYSFWQTMAELSCFYAVVWATIFQCVMIYEVNKPFFTAQRVLTETKEEHVE